MASPSDPLRDWASMADALEEAMAIDLLQERGLHAAADMLRQALDVRRELDAATERLGELMAIANVESPEGLARLLVWLEPFIDSLQRQATPWYHDEAPPLQRSDFASALMPFAERWVGQSVARGLPGHHLHGGRR